MDAESYTRLVDEYRGRMIANKYRVLGGLGYGNFAAVFLGYEPFRKRPVALKRFLIPRKDVEPVIAEIKGMEVLAGRPKIVQFFGYEVEELPDEDRAVIDGLAEDSLRFYIIMEYGGETLEKYLRRFGLKSAANETGEDRTRLHAMACLFTRDILEGLAGSHAEQIIHRDIKPLNIYINDEGEVRIGDFGVAKQVAQEGQQSGTVVGTAQYMAPEQVSEGRYGANVDLFATGVTLYRMLTGRLPFRNTGELLSMQPDLDLPELPPLAVRILGRALEKNPDSRYASATLMLEDAIAWGDELEAGNPGILEEERKRAGGRIRELVGEDLLETIARAESGEKLEFPTLEPTGPRTGGRPTGEPDGTENREEETVPPIRDGEITAPVRPVAPRLETHDRGRKRMKEPRASDRCLRVGDLTGAIGHLERTTDLEGDPGRIITNQIEVLRILAGWEQRVDQESRRLLGEKRYREAEVLVRDFLEMHPHSPLAARLEKVRKYRGTTSRILGRARSRQISRSYGRAIRLYRKAIRREPHLADAQRCLEQCIRQRSRWRIRTAVKAGVTLAVLAVLGTAVVLFRTDLAPYAVSGGKALQEHGWYASPPGINARDLFRIAGGLDAECAALPPARQALLDELTRKASEAAAAGDREAEQNLRRQVRLVAGDRK